MSQGLLTVGCASSTYHYSQFRPEAVGHRPIMADYGEPNKYLDTLAAIVDAPSRYLPLGNAASRDISPETADRLASYIEKNQLDDVHLSVNVYDPAGEWRRLHSNQRIGPGWRYTVGVCSVIGYTLCPGRVLGINHYNPYTDTLSINNDRSVELLKEAAEAKDIRCQRLPGTYAALTSLPVMALLREVRSVNDVLSYARVENDWELERNSYKQLYPHVWKTGMFGTGPLLTASMAWWAGPALGIGGALVGSGVGAIVAARREAEIAEHANTNPSPEVTHTESNDQHSQSTPSIPSPE